MPSLTLVGTPTFNSDSSCSFDTTDIVRGPSSILSVTQGWVAARVRPAFAYNATPLGAGADPRLFRWDDDTSGLTNAIQVAYSVTPTLGWYINRASGGSARTSPILGSSFASGDQMTVIAVWESTRIGLSYNGSAFSYDTNAQFIPSVGVMSTTFQIANRPDAARSLTGAVLWLALGSGTLSDANAATIHAFGNSDTTLHALPGTPIAFWPASDDGYFAPLSFASASAGSLSLVAASSGSLTLPPA